MTTLKALKCKPCFSFRACQKKFVEFTDLQTQFKKWQTVKKILLYMSELNTLQYKQCLCILGILKYDGQFMDQICKIYRPEKSDKVKTVQTELFINSNISLKYRYYMM